MSLDLSSKKKIFKEYDIRGVYPEDLDEDLTRAVVRFLVDYYLKEGKVVIGHDARLSSPALYKAAIAAAQESEGRVEVVEVGLISTPMLTFLVNDLGAAGGVIITASHNPKEYNGIKMVGQRAISIGGRELYKVMSKR